MEEGGALTSGGVAAFASTEPDEVDLLIGTQKGHVILSRSHSLWQSQDLKPHLSRKSMNFHTSSRLPKGPPGLC